MNSSGFSIVDAALSLFATLLECFGNTAVLFVGDGGATNPYGADTRGASKSGFPFFDVALSLSSSSFLNFGNVVVLFVDEGGAIYTYGADTREANPFGSGLACSDGSNDVFDRSNNVMDESGSNVGYELPMVLGRPELWIRYSVPLLFINFGTPRTSASSV